MLRGQAFTVIELLVVIAIIAILAALLFPVLTRGKEAALRSSALARMQQLGESVMMYADSYDDYLPPASMRSTVPSVVPTIWTEIVQPYIANKEVFIAPGSDAGYAENWGSRRVQSIGYNDATGYDPTSTAVEGAAPPGTEGFDRVVRASALLEPARIGLFAATPHGPKGDTSSKYRGYVFSPYNGLNSPDNDYSKGLPMISDRDLVVEFGDPNYPNSPNLSPARLKPIFCRYNRDRRGSGSTPVVFADGHAKSYTANQLNVFGTVIWRFR